MNIKQQHLEAIEDIEIDSGDDSGYISLNKESVNETAEKCSAITEDVAIRFAEWANQVGWYFNSYKDNLWHHKSNTHYSGSTSKEIFEIFNQKLNT